ncbi:hypothetical protein TWF718_004547 [Orbilia javanica]|uniref:F-box domain-containing protein n=1 Tax=Orbilia javanica TaxID=47235 RepID=A0AAN8RFM1_9PEZI
MPSKFGHKKSQKQRRVEVHPTLNGLPDSILFRLNLFLTIRSQISLSLVSHKFQKLFFPGHLKSTPSETCLNRTITRFLSPNIDPIGGSSKTGLLTTFKSLRTRQPAITCLYCGSLNWCPTPGRRISNGSFAEESECCNSPGVLITLGHFGKIFYDESIVSHKVDGYAENQGDLPYSWDPKDGGMGDTGRPAKPRSVGHRVFRPYTRWCRHHRCEGYIGAAGKDVHGYTDEVVTVEEEVSGAGKWRRWCNHCDLQIVEGWNARDVKGVTCKCGFAVAKEKVAGAMVTKIKGTGGCGVCGWRFVRVLGLKSKKSKQGEKEEQVASLFLEAGWKIEEAFGINYSSPAVKNWEIMDIILNRELGSTQEEEDIYRRKTRVRPRIYDLPIEIITRISQSYLTQSTMEVLARTDPAFAHIFGWKEFKNISLCAKNLVFLRSGWTDKLTGGRLGDLDYTCRFCDKKIRKARYRTVGTSIGLAVLPAKLVNREFTRPGQQDSDTQYSSTMGTVCPSHGILNNSSVLDGFGNAPGAWVYPPARAGIVIWCLHCQAIRGKDIRVQIETKGKKQAFKLEIGDVAAFWVEIFESKYLCKCISACGTCGWVKLEVFAGRMRNQQEGYSWNDIWWMEFMSS